MKTDIRDLSGEWHIALDRENAGIREKWFKKRIDQTIHLPGTTDEAGLGDVTGEACVDRLSRVVRWIGPAWYQRTVTIPKGWQDKTITLFLERTKDSQIWVDDQWAGNDDSLSAPHCFDLSRQLTPGKHMLTILVDNAKLPPVGPCHQVDERTQTNWNGILGRMELRAAPRVSIESVQAYPDVENRAVRVVTAIRNATSGARTVDLRLTAKVPGGKDDYRIKARRVSEPVDNGTQTVTCRFKLPDDIPLWDEFDRGMIELTVHLRCKVQGTVVMRDVCSVTFGMRELKTARGQFVINGRSIFLRGKNDCALFPLTGYAPMDKDYWLRHLGIAARYGINHYRFHSWCPPEAAFAAADELGIYFQVELPNKRGITEPDHHDYTPPAEAYETLDELRGDGGDPAARTVYLTREGERILKAYGNHPSFLMMTLGNEIGGDEQVMTAMCDHFRSLDDRHLYAMGTNHWHWDIKCRKGDQFWVIKGTSPGKHIRGASWDAKCHIDFLPPSTTVEYSASLLGVPIPVVGHEMAQFEVYPDYSEIKKYTGVLKAHNLEIFRERLKAAGMLDQAGDFQKASGAISLICHREDVEAALRTRGFGGFQMLDLQDFSGQGTALIGMLDVFMESKGLVTQKQWREFCCETVPLLWMKKYTWTNDEIFEAGIQVAHYGPADLEDRSIHWEIKADRRILASGDSRRVTLPTGSVTDVDLVSFPLKRLKTAQKLSVLLEIPGTAYTNRYDVWVYPAKVKTTAPANLTVARTFSRKVQAELAAGGSVLLLAKPDKLKQSVRTAFHSGFWSPMFRLPDKIYPLGGDTPGTQGILCDPKHPIFKDFPTEFHTNWQWWQLVKNSRAMILDSTPREYRPVVQMIDGFDRNHKLGLIFEAKVGKGKLIVCSIDLPALEEHPEARQLLASIQNYMRSRAFSPQKELTPKVIRAIV